MALRQCPPRSHFLYAGAAVGHIPAVSTYSAQKLKLEQALMREISRQWHTLNHGLFDGRLTIPQLELHDGGPLGFWRGDQRRLGLRRDFVLGNSWGEVVEVLKHEMAHQFVGEVLGVVDETPHGSAFRELCQRLAIDGRASGPAKADDPLTEKMASRIANLLALAESPNRHEAENAMRAAQALMLRYNLQAISDPLVRHYRFEHLGKPAARVFEYRRWMAAILGEFFFVEAIWVRAYVPAKAKWGSVLEICGTATNLEIASYVHDFLEQAAARLWRASQQARQDRKNRGRLGFYAGVMEGFFQKLTRERSDQAEAGLVWQGDADLSDYFRRRHPRIRSARVGSGNHSSLREQGREAGQSLVLHRGISSGPSAKTPHLLGQ